ILAVEKAAGVDVGAEHHRSPIAARIYRGIELLHAEARVEHAAPTDDDLVGDAGQYAMGLDIRRDALWIERVQSGKGCLAGGDGRRGGEMPRLTGRPIETAERFDAFDLRIAGIRRQTERARTSELVLYGLEHAYMIPRERASDGRARRERFDAD